MGLGDSFMRSAELSSRILGNTCEFKAHRGLPFCCRAADTKSLHFVCGLLNSFIMVPVKACQINQCFLKKQNGNRSVTQRNRK